MAKHPSIKTHKAIIKAHKKVTSTLYKLEALHAKDKPNYLKINELTNLGMDQVQELANALNDHDDMTAAADAD